MNQTIKQIIKQLISATANLIPIKTHLSPLAARDTLSSFGPKPTGTCYTNNSLNLQYDLQIIIPCYNVEKWVERCIESVLNQKTKYNVLVSIVNDGSTDGTESVIRDVMARYKTENHTKDHDKPRESDAVCIANNGVASVRGGGHHRTQNPGESRALWCTQYSA